MKTGKNFYLLDRVFHESFTVKKVERRHIKYSANVVQKVLEIAVKYI